MLRRWLWRLRALVSRLRGSQVRGVFSTTYPTFHLHTLGAPTVYFDAPDRLHLGEHVVLNDAFLDLHDDIWIGDHTFFGHRVAVLTGSHNVYAFGRERQIQIRSAPVRIHEGVWVASFSIILPGTEIGAHSVVSAGSVVRGNIPPYVIVAGNPAKIVKRLVNPGIPDPDVCYPHGTSVTGSRKG